MGDIVKVGWSGGKDSSCAVMLHILRGDKVKAVCYIPMFTNEIPLIQKKHYDFIMKTADKFRSLGAEVNIVHGITYWDYVTHIALSGKYKGQIFGFPCFKRSQCGFKRDSKEKACRDIDVGEYDYESIGIAFDEVKRHNQLNNKKRSILVEERIREVDTYSFNFKHEILSPIYEDGNIKRDGCVLCPNATKYERESWFRDYPEARELVIKLQDIVKEKRPDRPPLRNYEYFIETDVVQLSIFD